MKLSPSKLSTFLGCGLKYKYKYIDWLPDGSGQAAVNGTCIHSALEYLYQEEPNNRTLAKALEHLDTALDEWPKVTLFFPDRDRCAELVWALFDLEDPTTVNCRRTEMDMLVDWYEDHQLRGIVDRVDVEEDGYVIVDYKSGKAPADKYMDEKTLGIKMYALMGLKAFGKLPVRVKLLFLGNAQTVTLDVTESMVRGVEVKAAASVQAIERGEFNAKPGFACGFCSFKDSCPKVWTPKPKKGKVSS